MKIHKFDKEVLFSKTKIAYRIIIIISIDKKLS